MTRTTVNLTVNGTARTVEVEPRKTLADTIREDLGLTGTHLGCEQGVCGACTVLLDGQPVRSCLMFGVQAEGHTIRTIEGVASNGQLHPIQEAFSEYHGLQCGFCTPGMILASLHLLEGTPDPTVDEIKEALGGNLCRCTGYTKIIESVQAAAAASNSGSGR
jgi:carbon-monoxide dehydrogenase small subunit